MNQYLITPYQGKPYILEVPKSTTMMAFEAAMQNRHKGFCEYHLLSSLQKKKLEANGSMTDATT